jgi:hypothetical protein
MGMNYRDMSDPAGAAACVFLHRAAVLLLGLIAGCAAPQQTQQEESDFFAQFPPARLSETLIHSPSGDMTARVPSDWVSIDAEKVAEPGIFAVICNPEYTLSVVFNEVPLDNILRAAFERSGMNGLIQASYARRQRRAVEKAQGMQEVEQFSIGVRRFGAYMYTTDSMRTITRVALFYTDAHLYECSITHLTFNDRELPEPRIVRNIHQIILEGIEW